MKLLFVIGVEGAGHDMLRALMKDVIAQSNFVLEGSWRKMMIEYWDSRLRYRNEFRALSNFNRLVVKSKWQTIINHYQRNGVSHLVEDMSFPYYQPRNSMRRPDIIDFVDLVGDEVSIKFLVLYRNPVSATYSGLRRGFTKNVYEQARIVEDNLIYIDRHLSVIGHEAFRVLPFEEFLATPTSYIEGLADWIEVDTELLRKGIVNLRQPYPLRDIPTKTRQVLIDFFSPDRTKLWKLLCSGEHTIKKIKKIN